MLKRGSSPVDWCEANYSHSPFIAEFVNTVSNAIFLFLPPLLMWLFGPYGRRFNKGVHIIWGMLILVGLCSAYYHSTLSLLGQLLDELAILWVVAAAFALWYPNDKLPKFFNNKRSVFQALICGLALVSSGLALIQPAFNAFALMTLGVPALTLMISELNRCRNHKVVRLGTRCGAIWLLAVACWVNDKIFCEHLLKISPQINLHALWHILIFIASYTACVLFAYFDSVHQVPEQKPELRYWPNDKFELLGVPYVGWTLDPYNTLSVDVDSYRGHKQHLI